MKQCACGWKLPVDFIILLQDVEQDLSSEDVTLILTCPECHTEFEMVEPVVADKPEPN